MQMAAFNDYKNDKYAKEFGMTIADQLVSVDARVLPPPTVIMLLLKLFTFPFYICSLTWNWLAKYFSLNTMSLAERGLAILLLASGT